MITKILHNELRRLEEKCKIFVEQLEKNYQFTSSNYKANVDKAISVIQQIRDQLSLHLQLDDNTITTVDFYSGLQSLFELGRYQKGTEYYIQDGIGKKPVQVTDVDVLKREFMVENCLKCMKLVPMQIASNALKYMPAGQNMKVVLMKTPVRNYIRVSNIGPKYDEEKKDSLTQEGIRGSNSKMAGMGLGLAQVEHIIGLHNSLLDTSYSISQDNNMSVVIDGTEYTTFSIMISYRTNVSESDIEMSFNSFFEQIPLIILHNMVDVVANLISVTDRLNHIKYRNDKDFHLFVNQFKLDISHMQEAMKYSLYIYNGYSTNNMLGNLCEINIGDYFSDTFKLLCKCKYKNVDVRSMGHTRTVTTYSGLFPCIYGLCNFLLKNVKGEETDIDIDADDDYVEITCDSLDFDELLYDGELEEEPEMEFEARIKSRMYRDVFEMCNALIETDNNKLIINIDDAKNE